MNFRIVMGQQSQLLISLILKFNKLATKFGLQAIETITDTVNEFTQDLDAEDTGGILLGR